MKNELHVISNGHMPFEELVNVAMQIESEIDYLHIREREKSTKELYKGVESLLKKGFPASKLVINDRIDIAILLNIPRVQLGYRSADVRLVKEKFSYLHVGYSVHSLEEAIVAFKNGADSLVYGHVFPTDCKKGVPARGLEEISDIASCLSIPITAIGGITPENTVDVLTNGVSGIAVMSGIVSSSNPYSKAKSYKESIRKWAEKHV
ncbi:MULTISPECIES: thiazole tautomerase TenI [Bacillus]|uniref:Thiamine phosphate synthase n=1 Tax=Bacillus toyonensis TaxID=155322 RepID=A0A2B5F6S8_9BACI|nr:MULTISPECIES: thiazole tautomerase TenI [Bacillus]KNH40738.1 transcriptional regulator TenI [Bacillus thuringiensis]KXY21260.1 transcriptional regulator TenI [Bacillus cereus]MDH8703513.1 thiazole tautomerase (transcriptional regulator TenI) [Stenotrophomonas sp. 1198]AHA09299.1 Thiamin-phosphate pyrophosphorylase [Bacillus toyonensis BCT-7112]EJQ91593.1 thiamine-phosphate pyrophosphorylase [Bacillus toyonensis]